MSILTLSRYWQRCKRFGRDRDGISAVEFALVAPLMGLLYFGCIELSFMMQTDRRVTSSASTLGDLVARAAVIDNDDMSDIFDATKMIFQPGSPDGAKLRVSSLIGDPGGATGVAVVQWSDNRNWTSLAPGATVVIPENLIPAGGSVIMAEVEYPYSSEIGYFLKNERTLNDKFFLRPRRVNFVTRNTD